jgi:hypothetical protein
MTTYIHVGAPKTATTYVQGFLEANRAQIKNKGYRVVLPRGIRGSRCYQYHAGKHMRINTAVTLDAARSNFETFIAGPLSHTIISEEGFTHDVMPSKKYNGAMGGIKEAVESLYELTGGNAVIIITIRRQDTFIDSCYMHKIKWQGASLSYPEYFFNVVDAFSLSWLHVIKEFEKRFNGKVRVVPFELIKLGGNDFIKAFLQACNIDEFKEFNWDVAEKAKNESLSSAESMGLLEINRAFKNYPIAEQDRYKVISLVTDLIGGVEDKNFIQKLPDNWRRSLIQNYAKENEEIFKEYCSDVFDKIQGLYDC